MEDHFRCYYQAVKHDILEDQDFKMDHFSNTDKGVEGGIHGRNTKLVKENSPQRTSSRNYIGYWLNEVIKSKIP